MCSIFNLTNTLISRISTRRKEFGILESIGMTKKQIKKMLLHESVLLIIPCLIITVVAGPKEEVDPVRSILRAVP